MKKAYAAYLDAKCLPTVANEREEHRYTPEAIKGMQQAALAALLAEDPIPGEIRNHLAFALKEVCAGFESDLLSPVKRGGGRERPIAKQMQAAAIRYLRWAEDGRIQDTRPTATVAEAYGVTDRTVRNWNNAWRAEPTMELANDEWGADVVAALMQSTGKQYHRFIRKPSENQQSHRYY